MVATHSNAKYKIDPQMLFCQNLREMGEGKWACRRNGFISKTEGVQNERSDNI